MRHAGLGLKHRPHNDGRMSLASRKDLPAGDIQHGGRWIVFVSAYFTQSNFRQAADHRPHTGPEGRAHSCAAAE